MQNERRAHLAMLVSTALVATSFPAVATIAGALPSSVLAILRFVLAALVFLPIVVMRHGNAMWPDRKSLGRYALLSAPLAGFFAAMFEALRTTTPINSAAIFTLTPAFATVFAVVLVGERPRPRRLAAIALGMFGALWVVLRGDASRLFAMDVFIGDAWFLSGTALLGLYSVLVKRLHRGEPHVVMTFWTLVTGSLWLLVIGGAQLGTVDWSALAPNVMVVTAYLAVFTTLVTFFLTQYAATRIGPTRTMSYGYWNPALVAALAWWLDGEPLSLRAWPGVLITLIAMIELVRADANNQPLATVPACGRAC